MKIHKLYILPAEQGKGTGRKFIGYLEAIALNADANMMELHVNRGNPALGFYQRIGFRIVKEVDIPYHQFTLNDYIMQKAVTAGF